MWGTLRTAAERGATAGTSPLGATVLHSIHVPRKPDFIWATSHQLCLMETVLHLSFLDPHTLSTFLKRGMVTAEGILAHQLKQWLWKIFWPLLIIQKERAVFSTQWGKQEVEQAEVYTSPALSTSKSLCCLGRLGLANPCSAELWQGSLLPSALTDLWGFATLQIAEYNMPPQPAGDRKKPQIPNIWWQQLLIKLPQ